MQFVREIFRPFSHCGADTRRLLASCYYYTFKNAARMNLSLAAAADDVDADEGALWPAFVIDAPCNRGDVLVSTHLFPVRCISCAKPVAKDWLQYRQRCRSGCESESDILTAMGYERSCCRRMFTQHIDMPTFRTNHYGDVTLNGSAGAAGDGGDAAGGGGDSAAGGGGDSSGGSGGSSDMCGGGGGGCD